MKWKKLGEGFTATENELTATIKPKGDNRWTWEVIKSGATNPMATGVSATQNAAKRTSENFVARTNLG